ncbi:L,D-transpeptidase family protein [Shinella sp. AETb1-6]|uniref:L,D-transpeptidase family protein n=1 Tax=Shinella sp. AETb1-6 TaxID=2692210 RepID=UPI001368C78B|nr:murein L,D-transpeptidase family protein [Shinella sp. AETb1-6]MXN52956.1 L,D-transpeptidase family protein [Shinella sp. AETb1-6]
MRLSVLAAVSFLAVAAAGCTNETLDSFDKVDVDISKVSSKTSYQLSPSIVSKLASMKIDRSSPIMLRIFKEEGRLELWKADRTNRFQLVRNYKICAWSGKLGPKMKEGDRQAPEGFYPLSRANMNPNSSYFLAINTGFPNTYDRANKASGTNLMIHGACSSSGCYSMTDEQMLEIFAFARDAFDGGQKSVQLQAFPFRMTAENMARHRDNPNIEFWKMLKVGYDHFEVTKRPPEVNVCEGKYVFNQQADKPFSPTGSCPAMSTPGALQTALASYNKTYATAYAKAMSKYAGTVWIEPSEAQRKAIVADQRKGRELAYAPTGNSLDAGKLMTEREIAEQKRKAEEAERRKVEAAERAVREAEEAKNKAAADFAADVAATKAEKQARGVGSLPVPEHNPGIASAVEKKEKKPFWKLFSQDSELREAQQVQPVVNESAALQADQGSGEAGKTARTAAVAQETDAVATLPVAGGEAGQQVVEQTQKKPFWKFWQK